MKPIKLLPQHMLGVYYLFFAKYPPDQIFEQYDNEKMAEHNEDLLTKIRDDPSQLVQISFGADDVCSMCPNNSKGRNYDPNNEPCIDDKIHDSVFIDKLGLAPIADGKTVTAKRSKRIDETHL